jgi:hypothetical protein
MGDDNAATDHHRHTKRFLLLNSVYAQAVRLDCMVENAVITA